MAPAPVNASRVSSTGHHGVLVVDKPVGPTSHDIVAQARRLFATRRVGHAGTLDPAASGVLLLLVGEATKLSNYLMLDSKSYQAEIGFGRSTDTLDAQGQTTEVVDLASGWCPRERLDEALACEASRKQQIPPQFSAIKVGGRVAHRAARRGESLELAARSIEVHHCQLDEFDGARATLLLRVSKGFYVRSFARDLGATLGVPAHLTALRRLASGAFSLAEACPWPPSQAPSLLSLEAAVGRCLPTLELNDEGALRAVQGKRLDSEHFSNESPPTTAAAWLHRGRLVALGSLQDEGYRVLRGFAPPAAGSS